VPSKLGSVMLFSTYVTDALRVCFIVLLVHAAMSPVSRVIILSVLSKQAFSKFKNTHHRQSVL